MNVLRLFCDDKPGIVAAVATCLAKHECNIEESAQFNDPLSGQFFMRVVFTPLKKGSLSAFENGFEAIADDFLMQWEIGDLGAPLKTLIMVSKADHCLNDLLYRAKNKHLPIDIVGVVSNHQTCKDIVKQHGLKFHYMPVEAKTKAAQEEKLSKLTEKTGAELIVLARYMQILSGNFTQKYNGRVINIHHSFLPGFKGAKPYHQAYERGVKIIGATAHFVTQDLDEGPIIKQDIAAVDHSFTPQKMESVGRDIESRALAGAVNMFAQRRIFLHDGRTVIL